MKLLALITVAALMAPSMGFLENLTDPLKTQFNKIIDQLKNSGKAAIADAAQAALESGQASLLELLLKMTTELQGKRALKDDVVNKAVDIFNKLKQVVAKASGKATTLYEEAMNDLKDLAAKLKDSDYLSNLDDKAKAALKAGVAKAKVEYEQALKQMKELGGNIKDSALVANLKAKFAALKAKVDDVLKEHGIQMRAIEEELHSDVLRITNKRGLADQIKDFFQPHIETVKGHLTTVGGAIKDTAGNLSDKASVHLNNLKDKMIEHGTTLVGHGQVAVDQLKEAVTDILNESFADLAQNVGKIVDTGKNSITGAVDGINGAVQN